MLTLNPPPGYRRPTLTHWGRVTHICVSDLTIIGSDNDLSPGRCQATIRTNDGILLTRPLGTNFSEILIEILIFSFKEMRLKVSSAKKAAILSRAQCVKTKPCEIPSVRYWFHADNSQTVLSRWSVIVRLSFLSFHESDITWAPWRLKPPATRMFIKKLIINYHKNTSQFRITDSIWRESTPKS